MMVVEGLVERIRLLYCKGLFEDEISEELNVPLTDVELALRGFQHPYMCRVREDGWFVFDGQRTWGAINLFQYLQMIDDYDAGVPSIYIMNKLMVSPTVFYKYLHMREAGRLDELCEAYEEFHGPLDEGMVGYDVPEFPRRHLVVPPEEFKESLVSILRDGPVQASVLRGRFGGGFREKFGVYMRNLKLAGVVGCGVKRVRGRYVVFWFLSEDGERFRRLLLYDNCRSGVRRDADVSREVKRWRLRSKRDLLDVVPRVLEGAGWLSSREVLGRVLDCCSLPKYMSVGVLEVVYALRLLRGEGVVVSKTKNRSLYWKLA